MGLTPRRQGFVTDSCRSHRSPAPRPRVGRRAPAWAV